MVVHTRQITPLRDRSLWLRLSFVLAGAAFLAMVAERWIALMGASDDAAVIAGLVTWLIVASALAWKLNDWRSLH